MSIFHRYSLVINGVGVYSFVRQSHMNYLWCKWSYVPVYDGMRSQQRVSDLMAMGFYDWNNNLKRDLDNSDNSTINFAPKIITGLSIDLLDGLKYSGSFMYESRRYRNEAFFNEEMYKTRDLVNRFTRITGSGLDSQLPRGPIFEYNNYNLEHLP